MTESQKQNERLPLWGIIPQKEGFCFIYIMGWNEARYWKQVLMKTIDQKSFNDMRNRCCKIPSLLEMFLLHHLQNGIELGKGRGGSLILIQFANLLVLSLLHSHFPKQAQDSRYVSFCVHTLRKGKAVFAYYLKRFLFFLHT